MEHWEDVSFRRCLDNGYDARVPAVLHDLLLVDDWGILVITCSRLVFFPVSMRTRSTITTNYEIKSG